MIIIMTASKRGRAASRIENEREMEGETKELTEKVKEKGDGLDKTKRVGLILIGSWRGLQRK